MVENILLCFFLYLFVLCLYFCVFFYTYLFLSSSSSEILKIQDGKKLMDKNWSILFITTNKKYGLYKFYQPTDCDDFRRRL